jgi:hypothetical protein
MRRLGLILCLMAVASGNAMARMYKWTDEKGITHYGDTLPPQYADRASTELSNRGRVLKHNDPALTPEQIKARDEAQARQKEEQQKALEQKRKDSALLNTYTSEKEIDLARDRNLQQEDLVIKGTELRLKAARTRLDEFRKQKDNFTRAKKPVPADLQEDVTGAQQEVQHLQELIDQKQKDKDEIRTRYNADKRRYRELTQQSEGQ